MNPVAAPTLNRASPVRPGVSTRSGNWSKRKDEPSNRKRAEVDSARKTRVRGDVSTSRRVYQPEVLQRSPTETVVNEAQTCRWWVGASVARILRIQLSKEGKL